MKPSVVNFLHAIDTEGPLYENIEATFERIEEVIGVFNLPRDEKTLSLLKSQKIDLNGKESEVKNLLSDHRLNYMDSWFKLDQMLEKSMSKDFRNKNLDSFGNGWIYNWFCLDHVNYNDNPRRRTIGYHAIHDHYSKLINSEDNKVDQIQWHFHPMSTYKEAHRCATSYINSPHLYETLCRRIIERKFFPSVYRAGFQAERSDSNLFLEQWIPFDISNTSIDLKFASENNSIDFRNGRSGDWRRATTDWIPYHPHHDNYQLKGNCRRWIGRALNLKNRFANFDFFEIEKAFLQASKGLPTLVGLASHDFRDLIPEVEEVREMIKLITKKYPNVPYRFCNGTQAFQETLNLNIRKIPEIKLKLTLCKNPINDVPNLIVEEISGKVFGPQPFLAIETMGKRFIHDNFDNDICEGKWFYAFHPDTLPLEDVKKIGVAANDSLGRTFVIVVNV